MELNVLNPPLPESPWYSKGLTFTCTQCGNCCTGGPGYVWISLNEIHLLAEHLKLTPEQTVDKYCRKISGRFSLKERKTPEGLYDCVFLREQPSPDGGPPRKSCSVYSLRPLQCRTFPFWSEVIAGGESWKRTGERCPGIDTGGRFFTQAQIERVRDSADWPVDPPSSAPANQGR